MITVKCKSCQSAFKTKDEYAGRTLKCPNCSEAITVPSPKAEEVPEAPIVAEVDTAPPAPAQPTPVTAGVADAAPEAAPDAAGDQEGGFWDNLDQNAAAQADGGEGGAAAGGKKAKGKTKSNEPSLWKLMPMKYKLGAAAAVLVIVAGIAAIFMFGDTWERDNADKIKSLHRTAQGQAEGKDLEGAVKTWKQLMELVGDRTIVDVELARVFADAQDGYQLSLAKQLEKTRGPELMQKLLDAGTATQSGDYAVALASLDVVDQALAPLNAETKAITQMRQQASLARAKTLSEWQKSLTGELDKLLETAQADGADAAVFDAATQQIAAVEKNLGGGNVPSEVQTAAMLKLNDVKTKVSTLQGEYSKKMAALAKAEREKQMAAEAERKKAEEAARLAAIEAAKKPVVITAANAAEQFQKRYGAKIAAAKKTPDGKDDAKLAVAMLGAEPKTEAPMVPYLLTAIVELGAADASGMPTALQAIDKLERMQPDKRLSLLIRAADVAKSLFDADKSKTENGHGALDRFVRLGDNYVDLKEPDKAKAAFSAALKIATALRDKPLLAMVGGRLEAVRDLVEAQARLAALLKKLEESPDDQPTLMALTGVYLYEKDKPKQALPYVNRLKEEEAPAEEPKKPKKPEDAPAGAIDPNAGIAKATPASVAELQANVPVAAKPLKEIVNDELLQLAGFYNARGEDRKNPNRPGMYIRTKLYYEVWLSRQTKNSKQKVEVSNAKRQVEQRLTDLGVGMKLQRRLVKKLRGGGKENPAIQLALTKAIDWLYLQQDEKRHWDPADSTGHKFPGYTALVTYGLRMADEDPKDKPELRKAIDFVFKTNASGVYTICFRAHLWETLPGNPEYDKVMRADLRALLKGQNKLGTWHYGTRTSEKYDLSTTLAADLALWLGATNGVRVSATTAWRRVCETLIKTQNEDGGWSYSPATKESRSSMTAAGLTILLMAIDRNYLENYPDVAKEVDIAIKRGMTWFEKFFHPSTQKGGGHGRGYFHIAIQHVGLLSGRHKFGKYDWYDSIAKHLIETQKADGSWGSVTETAFAVIFLSRGRNFIDSDSASTASAE